MRRTFTVSWVAILSAALIVPAANGQVLPKNRAPGAPGTKAAPGPVPAQPAAPVPGETAGQTRREGRQDARDARAEARNAGETGPQARETARETRQATRQNIQATRPADMGVWFNNRAANGLVVSNLANNSAFANAGLRAGDQIVSINGTPVTSEAQFMQFLTGPNVGTQAIPLIVMRNGQQQTLNLQPTALTQGIVPYDPLHQYGLVLNSQNPSQLTVQQVYPRTPAYYAGIQQGDVITSLSGQPVTSLNTFTQGLSQANGAIPLGITRNGQAQNVELEPLNNSDSSVRTALRPNFDNGANLNTQGGANVTTPGINATTPGINATAPGANINVPGTNVTTPGASAGTSTSAQGQ
ncbi:MAG: PDZ domain-containing protein, partial [Planctomycetia bacterium]|nr:PDZ domain-containing protein [Planctomycetia bacterium]